MPTDWIAQIKVDLFLVVIKLWKSIVVLLRDIKSVKASIYTKSQFRGWSTAFISKHRTAQQIQLDFGERGTLYGPLGKYDVNFSDWNAIDHNSDSSVLNLHFRHICRHTPN